MTAYVAGHLPWNGMLLEDYIDATIMMSSVGQVVPAERWAVDVAMAASEVEMATAWNFVG